MPGDFKWRQVPRGRQRNDPLCGLDRVGAVDDSRGSCPGCPAAVGRRLLGRHGRLRSRSRIDVPRRSPQPRRRDGDGRPPSQRDRMGTGVGGVLRLGARLDSRLRGNGRRTARAGPTDRFLVRTSLGYGPGDPCGSSDSSTDPPLRQFGGRAVSAVPVPRPTFGCGAAPDKPPVADGPTASVQPDPVEGR